MNKLLNHRNFVKVLLGLAFLLFGAQQAVAIPSIQIVYETGGTDGSVSGSGPTLGFTIAGPTASVSGAGDRASGTIKVSASGIEDGNVSTALGGQILVTVVDEFTLHGPSAMDPVTFAALFIADGTGIIDNLFYSGAAYVNLGNQGFDFGQYQAGINAPLGEAFDILSTQQGNLGNLLIASGTYTQFLGVPFELSYSLRAVVSQGTVFDLSNTGHLNFILPEGVTITSSGGYKAGSTSQVPEPSTMLLFGAGLAGIGLLRKRFKS